MRALIVLRAHSYGKRITVGGISSYVHNFLHDLHFGRLAINSLAMVNVFWCP